jgi:UDP-N-acetylglucosamine-lysosomal-enzyme
MTKLYDLPISDESFGQFTSILMNCSGYSPKSDIFITKEIVTGCNRLSFFLQLNFGIRHKYKFEMIKDAERKHVFFKMLNSNVTEVFNQLDEIRKNTKKFVCLNDNLDQMRSVDNQMIKRLMLDFYISLFPIPSKFELPEHYRNRFLYIKDYVAMVEDQRRRFLLTSVLLIFLSFVLFLNFFKRRVCELIQKIFC